MDYGMNVVYSQSTSKFLEMASTRTCILNVLGFYYSYGSTEN